MKTVVGSSGLQSYVAESELEITKFRFRKLNASLYKLNGALSIDQFKCSIDKARHLFTN